MKGEWQVFTYLPIFIFSYTKHVNDLFSTNLLESQEFFFQKHPSYDKSEWSKKVNDGRRET